MSTLKVMEYNRIMLSALGAYPQPFTSSSLNWLRFLSPYFIVISLAMSTLLAVVYVFQGSTSLTYTFEAVIIVIGAPQALILYLNIKWKMNEVAEVNSKFQEIVDQGIKVEKILGNIVEFEFYSVTLQRSIKKLWQAFIGRSKTSAVISPSKWPNLWCSNKHHSVWHCFIRFIAFVWAISIHRRIICRYASPRHSTLTRWLDGICFGCCSPSQE